MTKTFLAPAKVNLFLHVIGRRSDGYHLLQSAFEFIDWYDEIDITPTSNAAIIREGDLASTPETDLAVRAARALQATSEWLASSRQGARILVRKAIPSGAGLGGGSSDAATTLLALNKLWGLGIDASRLSAIGLSLGADVPFFLFGRPAFAQGIGEQLESYESASRWLVLAVPQGAVPTAEIFAAPELTRDSKPLKIAGFAQAALCPVWEFGRNDLEPVTKARFPGVAMALDQLARAAAGEAIAPMAVRMSGSGGAVFCTTPDKETAERISDRLKESQGMLQKPWLAHLRVCKTLPIHPEFAQQAAQEAGR